MPVLLVWLGQALAWLSSNFLVKWAAAKVLLIAALTIILPWVLKDALQWFWKVGSAYRTEIITFINSQITDIIGSAGIDATLSITSVGGYIAQQIGLVNYFSILVSGFAICWALKFIGKFL